MAYSTNIHLHETFALNDLLFPTLLLKQMCPPKFEIDESPT